jgi:hypothetical protein
MTRKEMVIDCLKAAILGILLKRLGRLIERRWVLVCSGMSCRAVRQFTDVSEGFPPSSGSKKRQSKHKTDSHHREEHLQAILHNSRD